MRTITQSMPSAPFLIIGLITSLVIGLSSPAYSQTKEGKSFVAVMTDNQGVETELRNILFYWEEKVSETAFVPHELKHVPVKRGNATVSVKFDGIKMIEVKPAEGNSLPPLIISLANGNSGEFILALPGSFKGQSDFGETELPTMAIRKIVFK